MIRLLVLVHSRATAGFGSRLDWSSWESILALIARQYPRSAAIERAIELLHRRWSVPIIATLHRDGALRFADLAGRIAASRDTLSETLTALVRSGVVNHSTSLGQSARSEYALTERGTRLGDPCIQAVALVTAERELLLSIALKKWPMLVLVAVGRGAGRYNELKSVLTGITPRALAMALKDLEDATLVERTVGESYPPSTRYRLTEAGARLFPTMDTLVAACDDV